MVVVKFPFHPLSLSPLCPLFSFLSPPCSLFHHRVLFSLSLFALQLFRCSPPFWFLSSRQHGRGYLSPALLLCKAARARLCIIGVTVNKPSPSSTFITSLPSPPWQWLRCRQSPRSSPTISSLRYFRPHLCFIYVFDFFLFDWRFEKSEITELMCAYVLLDWRFMKKSYINMTISRKRLFMMLLI